MRKTCYNYRTAPAGDGSNTFTWTPIIPADGTYEVMVKYPSGVDGAATDARYVVDYGGLLNDVTTVDQTSGGGTWVSLGSFSLDEGNSATIELSDNANGTVLADGVKLVRDTSNDPADEESKSFDYAYDLNGNLTSLTDGSSGAEVDAYDMAYDGLNQLSKVVEKASGTVRNTTSYTHDANGNTLTRSHDSQDAEFVYDARDLVSKVTNTRTGKASKVTSYGYTARGQVASETKPNGNTVNYNYNLDGSVASQRETTSGGGLVAEHVLSYNANGHRVRDESTVQNADDPGAYLDHVYTYEFDPQDRLSSVTKRDAADSSIVSSESYTHDANANVVEQTINGTTTNYDYDRNRLLTANSGGVSASYNYDPFGRLNSVTSGGEIIKSHRYDGFDRMIEHQELDEDTGNLTTTTYDYDPLDRTTSKTEGGSTSTFDYLGLSDKVVSEEIDGALSRSYTYNAWGKRLSQIKHDASAGTEETSYYGYNLHSDVETLTDSNGQTIGTYGYTAYGKDDDTQFTGVDKPDPANPDAEPYNAYRFNGKRWDPNSESYDMGFRDYSPGLNRFLTRDTYNGALANMGLTTDPWTGNRYAFTGGNPISRIEIDGHKFADAHLLDDSDSISYSSDPAGFMTELLDTSSVETSTSAPPLTDFSSAKSNSSGGGGESGLITYGSSYLWPSTRSAITDKMPLTSSDTVIAFGGLLLSQEEMSQSVVANRMNKKAKNLRAKTSWAKPADYERAAAKAEARSATAGTLSKVSNGAGAALGAAGVGYDVHHGKKPGKAVISGASAVGMGMTAGAIAGSFIPVAGTAAGAAAGALVGGIFTVGAGIVGGSLGDLAYDALPGGVQQSIEEGVIGDVGRRLGDTWGTVTDWF